MGIDVQSLDIIIGRLVTWLFKSKYFQTFCKNYCCKSIEATIMIKVPNESKLSYVINILIVVSWLSVVILWQSFKLKDKLKCIFFGDVNVSINASHGILKFVSTLNAFYVRTRSVNI